MDYNGIKCEDKTMIKMELANFSPFQIKTEPETQSFDEDVKPELCKLASSLAGQTLTLSLISAPVDNSQCDCCLMEDQTTFKLTEFHQMNELYTKFAAINICPIEGLLFNTKSDFSVCALCIIQLESASNFINLCKLALKICSDPVENNCCCCLLMDLEIEDPLCSIDEVQFISGTQSIGFRTAYSSILAIKDLSDGLQICDVCGINLENAFKFQMLCREVKQTVSAVTKLEREEIMRHSVKIEGKHTCQQCLKQYDSARNFQNHFRVEHLKEQHVCQICSKVFTREQILNQHVKTAHFGLGFPCPQCGKTFTEKRNLQSHENTVHKKLRLKCDQCDRAFGTQAQLKFHSREAHLNVRNICSMCDQNFNRPVHLAEHEATVHFNQKINCKSCPETFATIHELNVHEMEMHNKKNFRCRQCKTNRPSPDSIRRHVLEAHENSVFKCSECGDSFSSQHRLNVHEKAAHMRMNPENDLSCLECNKTFTRPCRLYAHQQSVHFGVRHNCNWCEKSFTQVHHLKQHVKKKHLQVE